MTTSIDGSFVPVLKADVTSITLGTETLLWPVSTPAPLYLHSFAALLFSVLDGTATVSELADDVVDALELAPAEAFTRVSSMVETLSKHGLLVGVSDHPSADAATKSADDFLLRPGDG